MIRRKTRPMMNVINTHIWVSCRKKDCQWMWSYCQTFCMYEWMMIIIIRVAILEDVISSVFKKYNPRCPASVHHEEWWNSLTRKNCFSQDRSCERRVTWHEKILISIQRISNEIPRRIIYLQIQSMWSYHFVRDFVFLLEDLAFVDDTLKNAVDHALNWNVNDVCMFVFETQTVK